ncbi:hypothetical protein [Microbacterium sp. 77mftsu3.1]|uniref:hypothetical protein n=1 Tax=Microbacterium sp. 77mftsu3.1 TaxID=1761802 RepID=UPI000380B062|nr:hypothetical protein [Microbacterium sp. 77mftsu3.1]SDH47410.1 hypothetical protein SAMN04488590_3375 [Microbacterium sp. 77mftsu3.1]
MAHVITLPAELTSRAAARHLIPKGTSESDIVIAADSTLRASTGALDELVKTVLATGCERVTIVNATDRLERALRVVHRARTKPERTFLLLFREVPAEALLRAV